MESPHTTQKPNVCGSVKVSGSVSRAGNAVVLAKLHLIGSNGATDTTVGAGVVVMPWGALNCKDNMDYFSEISICVES